MAPEDEAMLIAGPRRVAEVAVAALAGVGALVFDGNGMVRAVRTGGAVTQAQARVLALAARPGSLGALVDGVAAQVRVEPFIERGLLVPPRRWRALTLVAWLGNLAAIGVLAAPAFGVMPTVVLPLLIGSLFVGGVAGHLRGPMVGPGCGLAASLRRTPLTSVPPLNRVARAGLQGGTSLTPERRPMGGLLGVPGAAPPQRGRVGGWFKGWVSGRPS
ncbi:uncharacterized protein (TIGR04222 family) [Saccharothrix ecbatanensis]|uniref:Uncharacterized protein (TIGR04222 family) n=1 Tax=Saccharothrix ecbatanensis TaxID=1105145 RepID=A0A7W9HN14_9PSEU|nr:hypothetical protein [Saccharothrix ecbatanensis]MBB5805011.1 uncharacterized protein (TIGR04222 family) [Saccharothrix ecbatanensis]